MTVLDCCLKIVCCTKNIEGEIIKVKKKNLAKETSPYTPSCVLAAVHFKILHYHITLKPHAAHSCLFWPPYLLYELLSCRKKGGGLVSGFHGIRLWYNYRLFIRQFIHRQIENGRWVGSLNINIVIMIMTSLIGYQRVSE